ncbi:L-aspartate oxidase [Arthrobacter sp. H41]|uniref:L-aspartate oxidase n=1 Tax=Arthrobacter sp. H41 TaxID=1312978 RepID=UPI000675BF97|nr:L-aspartate oxidase [Arthrobacter sp. H41]
MSQGRQGAQGTQAQRVVVVGGGAAGLYSALTVRALDPGAQVTLLTKRNIEESNTRYAQGGIAAVIPGIAASDSIGAHIADTLAAGAGLCAEDAVTLMCGEAPQHIAHLEELGVPFDAEGAQPALGREAAHSAPRILRIGGDASGAGLFAGLIAAVRADGAIEVVEHAFVTAILRADDEQAPRAAGVELITGSGAVSVIEADAVVLATGGAGQLFEHTTNPSVATADGVALAWYAGAAVADAEFFQFHPTALDVPGNPLISEAVRGEGAHLVDASGQRFLQHFTGAGDLAPRDLVSRSIARHLAATGEARVFLDATGLGRSFLERRFPTLTALTRRHGLDWSVEPIPVVPAAHYWMGGVRTDTWGRTSLPGLYAAGEVACTGVHGANRLASNSLLEGLVFGARAAAALSAAASVAPWPVFASTPLDLGGSGVEQAFTRAELQRLMSDHVGVVRDGNGLRIAAKQLAQFGTAVSSVGDREQGNLLLAARLVVHAAAARTTSRGAHYRSDDPDSASNRPSVPEGSRKPVGFGSSMAFSNAAAGVNS